MLKSILRYFLPLALLTSSFSLLIYVSVQQVYRQSANDPQIQQAEDVARLILAGRSATMVASSDNPVEISLSLAPFVAVFDDQGRLLSSTGKLHSEEIRIPSGTFDYARTHLEHRFTWQPEPGVRQAVVLVRYEQGERRGFVLAGRSLRESEQRTHELGVNIFIAWVVTILGSIFVSLFCVWLGRR